MDAPLDFDAFFHGIPLGQAWLDGQGRVLLCNQALARFFGCKPAELTNVRLITAFSSSADAAHEAQFFLDLVDGRLERYALERRYRRLDGVLIWGSVRVAALPTGRGRYACSLEDVTERVQANARKQREVKLEGQARLADELSRHLNPHLVAAMGSCHLLLEDVPPESPLRETAESIGHAIERAVAIQRALAEHCIRPAASIAVVDFNQCIARLLSRLRSAVGHDVEMVTALQPGLGPVRLDVALLEKALHVLAAHAREAMPNGGKWTLATGVHPRDDVTQRHQDATAHVVLSLTDTGPGLSATSLERIFEPCLSTKLMGVRLAAVHRIVRQLGGYVDVATEPGQGTRFSLCFPRAEETLPDIDVASDLASTLRERSTILILRDEDRSRQELLRYFAQEGYGVLEARFVGEALAHVLCQDKPLHLLLADLAGQPVDVLEFIEQVRTLRPGLSVLLLDEPNLSPALVSDVLLEQSTISLERLSQRVRELLRRGSVIPPTQAAV